ncbi:MAG: MarR family winged helix-turn-helix transcriptional regulator [Longimicrobiales bacterium]
MQSLLDATIPADLAQDSAELAEAINDFTRVLQFRDRDRVCCYDISVTDCHALKLLSERGSLTVNDLAAALYLDKSTTSRVARGLEARKYVRKARDQADGRQVKVEITEGGQSLVSKVMAGLAAEYAVALQDLSPEVRRSTVDVLNQITAALSARIVSEGGRSTLGSKT